MKTFPLHLLLMFTCWAAGCGSDDTIPLPSGNSLAVLPDGHLILAGTRNYSSDGKDPVVLMKIAPDGSIDKTFGTNGQVEMNADQILGADSPSSRVTPLDLVVLPNGKIVLYADVRVEDPTSADYYQLVRCLPDGTLDTILPIPYGLSAEIVTYENGKLGIPTMSPGTGILWIDASKDTFEIDHSFGIEGFTSLGFNPELTTLLSNGKSIVVGQKREVIERNFAEEEVVVVHIARFDAYGELDGNFGDNGIATTMWSFGIDSLRSLDVIELSNGEIVVAGGTAVAFEGELLGSGEVHRFFANGAHDSSRTVRLPVEISVILELASGDLLVANREKSLRLTADGQQALETNMRGVNKLIHLENGGLLGLTFRPHLTDIDIYSPNFVEKLMSN